MTVLQRPTTRAVPIDRTGSPMCPESAIHGHCRCGAPVTKDEETVTSEGRYSICRSCWEIGRRRWFRPDTKAERIAALERMEGLRADVCE